MTENKIGTFEDLFRDVETKLNFSSNWHILKDPEAVCFYQLKSKHHRVYFATKVFVNQDLVVKIILKDCELPADGQRLQYWLQLEKILSQFDLGCDLELKAPYCMNRAWEFLSKINEASLDIENNLQLNFLKEELQAMLQDCIIIEPTIKIKKVQMHKSVDTSSLSKDPFDAVVAVKEEKEDFEDYQQIKEPETSSIVENVEIFENEKILKDENVKMSVKKPTLLQKIKRQEKRVIDEQISGEPEVKRSKKEPLISCSKCPETFMTEFKYNIHFKTHPLDEPLKCPYCEKEFSFQIKFKKHQTKCKASEKQFTCHLCGKAFVNIHVLQDHLMRHDPEDKKEQCPECDKKFLPGNDMKKHLKRHLNLRPHICHVCSKGFTQAIGLRMHLFTHTADRPVCAKCNQDFSTPIVLKQHSKNCKGIFQPLRKIPGAPSLPAYRYKYNYKCVVDDCEKSKDGFKMKKQLKVHLKKVHDIEVPLERYCLICKKEFESENLYFAHVREHYCIYICRSCGKRFRTEEVLKRHELKHSGTEERLFGCDVCGLKLKSESSIKSHKLIIHSSERNFVCQQCDQKFVFSRLLERHVKVVHEGETQYSCKLCLENFRYMRQYKCHMLQKHNTTEVYFCDVCDMRFKICNELKNHKNEMHGKNFKPSLVIQEQQAQDVVLINDLMVL